MVFPSLTPTQSAQRGVVSFANTQGPLFTVLWAPHREGVIMRASVKAWASRSPVMSKSHCTAGSVIFFTPTFYFFRCWRFDNTPSYTGSWRQPSYFAITSIDTSVTFTISAFTRGYWDRPCCERAVTEADRAATFRNMIPPPLPLFSVFIAHQFIHCRRAVSISGNTAFMCSHCSSCKVMISIVIS